jgi:hypothetical protein
MARPGGTSSAEWISDTSVLAANPLFIYSTTCPLAPRAHHGITKTAPYDNTLPKEPQCLMPCSRLQP